ncbi:ATP-dependent DNA ligase [Microbacterium sp. SUBG005]|nr:ATP-dependent DNA ligase [Microbacterium sp. SUBG005]
MGKFIYDSSTKTEFEDRLLAHLQVVIMTKVRRGESFTFTWKDDVSTGGGRTTVFIHPHASLQFKYHGGRQPHLNPAWVNALTFNANSPRGLYVVREPDPGGGQTSTHAEMLFGEVVR